MSALSDRIAAEHQAHLGLDDELHCSCVNWTASFGVPEFEEHLIAATERAVRETVAQEVAGQEDWLRSCVDFTADERQVGLINGYRSSARIAREGTTP